MNNRKMPSKDAIRKYWADKIDLTKKNFDSKFEFIEEKDSCFSCGQLSNLQRCHIKPKCEGGQDSVDNLHLLCPICHKDSEFLKDKTYWDWFYQRTCMDMFISLANRKGFNIWSELY
ncbi:MAG: HNH endonuclease [Desulfobacterales bacterium]|nr:HNH endonuclease [Desulfobacterales bacterium]